MVAYIQMTSFMNFYSGLNVLDENPFSIAETGFEILFFIAKKAR